VTTIESSSFLGCNILSSVVFGSGLTSIAINAFSGTSLRKAVWLANTPPAGYNYVSAAINYVPNDKYTALYGTVKYPSLSSYFDVDGLRYVPISLSEKTCAIIDCTYDPEYTFVNSIQKTVRYKGVTMDAVTIHPYLFYNNKYIKRVEAYSKADVPMYGYAGCSNIKTVIFHDFVMMINPHAFSGCSSLESIVFGTHLSTIGEEAFSDCTAVTEITTKNTTPPFCSTQAIEDINKWECKLFVPVGYQSAYQAADQWKEFLYMEEGTGNADRLLGDVNGDNSINETDLNMIVSHIMGNTPEGFIEDAADINVDGFINAADVVLLVNAVRLAK
jgi:hypothetical protein